MAYLAKYPANNAIDEGCSSKTRKYNTKSIYTCKSRGSPIPYMFNLIKKYNTRRHYYTPGNNTKDIR